MSRPRFCAVLVAGLLLATSVCAQDQVASADETARLLAGMEVPAHSPLAHIAQDPNVKQHAAYFDAAFARVETRQLEKIRAWSAEHLKSPKPVMFYMFGGPDFLYANAFFPHATTYVLIGLEPVGQIPDVLKLPRWSLVQALKNIQVSLRSVLSVNYFITAHMSHDLSAGPLRGTLPILYVFLARAGKTIHDVSLVHLDEQGALQPGEGARSPSPARGAKIVFSDTNDPQKTLKTLYYFSTNLADQRGKPIALLQFCKSLGQADSFIKSASYLMHNAYFSQVRNFLLDNSSLILQDDSGVPVRLFDPARWHLRPFGRYVGPIPLFEAMYQSKLSELHQRNPPSPIDFGVGYRWQPNESNLLLAIRKTDEPEATATVSQAPSQTESETAPATRAYRAPPSRPHDGPLQAQAPRYGFADGAPRDGPFRRAEGPLAPFPFILFVPLIPFMPPPGP